MSKDLIMIKSLDVRLVSHYIIFHDCVGDHFIIHYSIQYHFIIASVIGIDQYLPLYSCGKSQLIWFTNTLKQFHDAKVFNTRLPSFVIPKYYGSLTHETIIKDAVNMEDLVCFLATVCTLKVAVQLLSKVTQYS